MEDKLILLVEDNPHIMAINDAALHMRGYRTLQAETARKCRELLCFHAVDLIVLDILLPDGDGVALCREIKQEYDVPILFLTAIGEDADIVKGLTAGGDDYLTKPYDLEVFMARVEARLRAAHPKERAVRLRPLQMNLLSGRAYIGGDRPEPDAEGICGAAVSGAAPEPQRQRAGAVRGGLAAADGSRPACRAHDDLSGLSRSSAARMQGSRCNSYRSSGYRLEEQ